MYHSKGLNKEAHDEVEDVRIAEKKADFREVEGIDCVCTPR